MRQEERFHKLTTIREHPGEFLINEMWKHEDFKRHLFSVSGKIVDDIYNTINVSIRSVVDKYLSKYDKCWLKD